MENHSSQHPSKTKLHNRYEKYMFVVGILGQLLYYVQGVKIFIDRSAEDVSLPAFLIGFVAVSSWMVYGIVIKNKVLVISNIVAMIGALFVIIGKLLYH